MMILIAVLALLGGIGVGGLLVLVNVPRLVAGMDGEELQQFTTRVAHARRPSDPRITPSS